MSRATSWIARPPSLALAALCLVFLSPVGESPGSSPQTWICPAGGDRVAVAALGTSSDTEISAIAGRAPYFLIFESTDFLEVVANEHAKLDRGAGARAAYRLSDLEIDCLVAGEAGSRMRAVLAAEGIEFSVAEGEAAAVIFALRGLGGTEGF